MRVRFKGGPWDGAEFDVPYLPDQIGFRHLLVETKEHPTEPLTMLMSSDKREHHQYLLKGRKLREGVTLSAGDNLQNEPEEGEDPLDSIDENLVVYIYEHAPGKKLWWQE